MIALPELHRHRLLVPPAERPKLLRRAGRPLAGSLAPTDCETSCELEGARPGLRRRRLVLRPATHGGYSRPRGNRPFRGGIEQARSRARLEASDRSGSVRSERLDIEGLRPEYCGYDLIFARGLHIFKQHDMTTPGCIGLLEELHSRLSDNGVFFSSYGGRPHLEGQYTPMSELRLPLNRQPRRTEALDFHGGKFNHSQKSFLGPFLESAKLEVHLYRYSGGRHACLSGTRPSVGGVAGSNQQQDPGGQKC